MSAVLDYLKESGVFYLSTMDGNQPRVRPFGAVCEFEGKLYFITAKKQKRLQTAFGKSARGNFCHERAGQLDSP